MRVSRKQNRFEVRHARSMDWTEQEKWSGCELENKNEMHENGLVFQGKAVVRTACHEEREIVFLDRTSNFKRSYRRGIGGDHVSKRGVVLLKEEFQSRVLSLVRAHC